MVIVNCPIADCAFATEDADPAIAVVLLTLHGNVNHSAAPAASQKGPSVDRPRIDLGTDTETWNMFERRWEAFRRVAGFSEATASAQLFHCATEALGDVLLKSDPHMATRPLDHVLIAMRTLAVIPVSRGVIRAELMRMDQSPDEAFRTFAARVRGKAEMCGFRIQCQCACALTFPSDYTDDMVRDVLMAGIADLDIRREALGAPDMQEMPINEIIAFVERREMARNALPAHSLSAVSSFKHDAARREREANKQETPRVENMTKKAPCPDCKKLFLLFSGRNTTAHRQCLDCFRLQRRRRRDAERTSTPTSNVLEATSDEHCFAQISGAHIVPKTAHWRKAQASETRVVALEHHIFSAGEWRRARFAEHPTVQLQVSIAHKNGNRTTQSRSVDITAITDTGAQSNLWSLREFLTAGFSKDALLPVSLGLRAANATPIKIAGAFFAKLDGYASDGSMVTCRSMIYVSETV